jgi:DNA-3-methyladenine glycosylase I
MHLALVTCWRILYLSMSTLWRFTVDVERCPWAADDKLMVEYHDVEWGTPVFRDQKLFEFLVLESAQAGLSWRTILHRRDGYRKAYRDFSIESVASFTPKDVEKMLMDPGIIRNRRKVEASINNARRILEIKEEWGSLSEYLWSFTGGKTIVGAWKTMEEMPVTSPLSDMVTTDLKKRGFTFVGSTIVYSYLQAVGVVNDHLATCFRFADLADRR